MRGRNPNQMYLMLIVAALVLAACAGPNPAVETPNAAGDIAGFWSGLWQGLIMPFAFVISLFNDTVGIYDVHNNGNWYNFGFVLGAMACPMSCAGGSASNKKKQRSQPAAA